MTFRITVAKILRCIPFIGSFWRIRRRLQKQAVLAEVTDFYLGSGDFNGITAPALVQRLGLSWVSLTFALKELIESDQIGILFQSDDVNIHVNRRGFSPPMTQVSKLGTDEILHACIYPRPKHLEGVVDRTKYGDCPYTLALALGEPQITYRSFDLSVLEYYRNDPRYIYHTDDLRGYINVKAEHYEGDQMMESDKQVLQTFGFAYDDDMNRAVAVFLRYLADLGPEHQQIWKAKELPGDYRLHPDYYRNTILGEWGDHGPILTAFLIELYIINRMAEAMDRPTLFRKDYGPHAENRPQKFGFLVRPTQEEFNEFVLLSDKLLSDNIDKAFFLGEVSDEIETTRKDGRVGVQPKGTLLMLDEWIRKSWHPQDWTPWDQSIDAFRKVRKLRQQPAHAIKENVFDQRFFKKQQSLIIEVYEALRTLRLILANHPGVKSANIDIPDWLASGKIWTY